MRLRILLVLGTLGLIVAGASGVYTAVMNQSPTAMTCDEFASGRKHADWVRLTSCDIDYGAIYDRESRLDSQVTEFFVPIRPAGSKDPAPIVISVKDSDLAQQASGAKPSDENKRLGSGLMLVVGLMRKVNPKEGVVGLVQGNIEPKLLWKALTEKKIRPDAVLIDLNEKPSLGLSLFMLALGLGLAMLMLRGITRRAHGGAPAASRPGPPPVPPRPVTPGTR